MGPGRPSSEESSCAADPHQPFCRRFDQSCLQGILSDINNGGIGNPNSLAPTIPETVYMCFQMTFAIITPALIAGAFAERMKFSAMLWFMGLWAIFVYAPVAHWLWGPDGIFNSANDKAWVKVLDFAGGTVVHIDAGVAGLVAAIMVGKRRDTGPGHNMVLTFIGAAPAVGRLVRLQCGLRGQRGRAGRHGDDRHPDRDRGRGPDLDVRRMVAPRQADGHRHRLGRGRRPRRHHAGLGLRRSDRLDGDRRRLRRRLLPRRDRASSTPSAMTTRSTASASTASAAAIGAILTGVFAIQQYGGTAGLIEGNPGQVINQCIGIVTVIVYDAIVTLIILSIIKADDRPARLRRRRARRSRLRPARRGRAVSKASRRPGRRVFRSSRGPWTPFGASFFCAAGRQRLGNPRAPQRPVKVRRTLTRPA